MRFGEHIRQLREKKNLLLRHLASDLDIDTAMMSKIERSERKAKRELIPQLAKLLNTSVTELQTLYMADQIIELIDDEENPQDILNAAEKEINQIKKQDS
ncbi:helix-turn-helix domain-containing protein [Mariniflexile gromovii]|uniref:Helix-turn-helix transcriptional regulator n=1 Tax=Mariniflexile gromovii TaxID=362523 RepID=A0ABS4BNN9_9FLAO|nr:helix-turn-helix transcriptional regulator [Mariniflexile gromovii]MBP0902209.1 helix-turn-helix transcriptional regulator [Mariniflexile gromovii]